MTGDQYALTSSSLIRQVVSLGGDIRKLRGVLPEVVIEKLRTLQRSGKTEPPLPGCAGGLTYINVHFAQVLSIARFVLTRGCAPPLDWANCSEAKHKAQETSLQFSFDCRSNEMQSINTVIIQ